MDKWVPNITYDAAPVRTTDTAVAYPFNTESACFNTLKSGNVHTSAIGETLAIGMDESCDIIICETALTSCYNQTADGAVEATAESSSVVIVEKTLFIGTT